MAQVVLGTSKPQDLDASRERVGEQNAAIVFARVVKIGGRVIGRSGCLSFRNFFEFDPFLCFLVLYATKSFMQVTLHALEAVNSLDLSGNPRRSVSSGYVSFRSFGEVWLLFSVSVGTAIVTRFPLTANLDT